VCTPQYADAGMRFSPRKSCSTRWGGFTVAGL
jgi:hypothetical protein